LTSWVCRTALPRYARKPGEERRRASDVRAAQQLSVVANLPLIAVTSLIAFNVIHATLQLALVCGIALLVLDRLGWRFVSLLFDRERLISGTR